MAQYGIVVKDKKGERKVVVLGKPYEFRKGTPIFNVADDEQPSAQHLLTAKQIKTNWRAWASDLYADAKRITPEQAKKRNIEIL